MEERADEPVAPKELEANENKAENTPASGELARGEDDALSEGGAASAQRVSASNGAPQELPAALAVPESEPTLEQQTAAEAELDSQPAVAEAETDSQLQQPEMQEGGAAEAPAADTAAEEESQPVPVAGIEATDRHSSSGSAGVQPDNTAEPAQPLRRSSAGGAAAAPATHKEAPPAPAAKAREASKPAEKPAEKVRGCQPHTDAPSLTGFSLLPCVRTSEQPEDIGYPTSCAC